MEQAGELKIRINAVPIRVPDGATEALPLPELYESPFLTVNTVKFFADGGLSGKTSALKHHYRDSNEKGVLRLDENWFKKLAKESQEAGFKIATHAIGDAAIDMVLNVYESLNKNQSRKLRHRIEHLGLPELSHLIRMKNLGIHAVPQPIFLYELGPNFRQYLPDFYLENVYPIRSMMDAGLNVAFSSDAPVVRDFNPLMGIQNALERKDNTGQFVAQYQNIGIEEALKAYTLGAAFANSREQEVGSLELGKKADFIVLDKNPLETPVSEISKIQVLETWVDGQCAYQKTK
jgi:predicted amidohydrolase YtcJ